MTYVPCKSATLVTEEIRLSAEHTFKPKISLLREPSLAEIANYMREMKEPKVVVISGPRISLPLGIPDFRSPDVGLYHSPFDRNCYCCDAFNKQYFVRKEAAPLYKIAWSVIKNDHEPTFSHYFIAFLEHKGILLKNYSENMDDLEKKAGTTRCTQINGSYYSFICIKCRKEYSLEWANSRFRRDKLLLCTLCASLVKPNVLLYGEDLPMNVFQELEVDMKECKLLILLGTTLSSEVLSTVLRGVDFKYPRVYINDTDPYNFSDFHFYCKHDHNDVINLGNIDSTCIKFVNLLGWGTELQEFAKQEYGL